MNKTKKILFSIYSIITIFCLFYGVPLTIINAGKDDFFIYLSIAIIGIVLLIVMAIYILIKQRNK